jgi:hypothetical protein
VKQRPHPMLGFRSFQAGPGALRAFLHANLDLPCTLAGSAYSYSLPWLPFWVTPSVMAPAETALVLIGYLEHDSHRQPWLVNAKRQGITVKEVEIRTPPKSPEI